jgi:hypothetical protein
MVKSIATFHDEALDVVLNVPTNLLLEYFPSHSSESWTGIFQTLRHSHETEGTKRGDEASFFLILFRHPAQMVAGKAIQ